jgi:membrane protease YdiL (CAAX protease family)
MVLASYHWNDLRPLLTRVSGLIHPAAWAGFLMLAPLLLLNYGYHNLLTKWLGVEAEDYTNCFSSTWGPVIFICVMPAITEEIAFRGMIQHQFEKVVKPSIAIAVAAMVFAAAHMTIVSAPYLALVGLLLGWMKTKTGSLYPSMIAHFLHNYIVITYF